MCLSIGLCTITLVSVERKQVINELAKGMSPFFFKCVFTIYLEKVPKNISVQ